MGFADIRSFRIQCVWLLNALKQIPKIQALNQDFEGLTSRGMTSTCVMPLSRHEDTVPLCDRLGVIRRAKLSHTSPFHPNIIAGGILDKWQTQNLLT